MKNWFLFGCLFLLCLCSNVRAQENYFRIVSFVLDKKPVDLYTVIYEVNGKEIIPRREGNQIFVPKEVQPGNDVFLIFQTGEFRFAFKSNDLGYNETSELRVDVHVGIDTLPFEFDTEPFVLEFNKKERKWLRQFDTLYLLKGEPTFSPESDPTAFRIADPITTIKGENRKKKQKQ